VAETGAELSTFKDILSHSVIRMVDRYAPAVESRKRTALERIADYAKSAEIIELEERRIG
jgi:hypothetical protein